MSQAKVKTVGRAQKDQGSCAKCGKKIQKGEPYRWFKVGFRSRHKRIRCMDAKCRPKPSELESTDRSGPMAAVEEFEDMTFDNAEDLSSAVEDVQAAFDEYVDICESAMQGWPNGNSQLEERLEQATQGQSTASMADPDGAVEQSGEDAESVDFDEARDALVEHFNGALEELG